MALQSTVSDLWQSLLSARTYQTYNVGYRTYASFLASNGVIWIGKQTYVTDIRGYINLLRCTLLQKSEIITYNY